jgi:UDP-N-acetylglucosamine--N-acetylmuramyl-(pentapeptide) pyrophosphoryl-undecaprenol N-acetylglucosamine transferase
MAQREENVVTVRGMIAGGGTGGHVYPGLALVERIRDSHPDAAFTWVGNPDKVEARIIPQEGIEFLPIRIRGFSRRMDPASIVKNIGTAFQAAGAMKQAKKMISSFEPDFVVGTGGYVCGPVLAQATRMKIPSFLIEPNSYPGLTVRWLSKRVDRIYLGSDDAKRHLPGADCLVTGVPVTKAIMNTTRDEGIPAMGLLKGKPCMLIVGGSQGAENINRAVIEFVKIASEREPDLLRDTQILHQTGGKGPAELEGLRWEYPDADYVKVDYIDRMAYALASADIVISRAGAATLSEIKARGLPSILIPYPHAAEGHQLKNARNMEGHMASAVIEDRELNGETLFQQVIPLMKDENLRKQMGEKAKEMYNPRCLDIIYADIFKFIEK